MLIIWGLEQCVPGVWNSVYQGSGTVYKGQVQGARYRGGHGQVPTTMVYHPSTTPGTPALPPATAPGYTADHGANAPDHA